MTKKTDTKNKRIIIGLASILALTLLVGGISVAKADGASFWDRVAEFAGKVIGDKVNVPSDEMNLGAFPGTDVYEKMHFKGGMVKTASFYAPLNWSAGTTTAAAGETTVVTLAKVTNDTGKDLLCRDAILDISTARAIWGGDMAVGTTTALGDVSLTATSTATLIASNAITTTTIDILNKEDDEGSDANVYWSFPANSILTVSDTFDTANATSSASFTAEGGFTGAGSVNAECWYRNN